MVGRPLYLMIVNPASAGGTTGRRWPRVREVLRHVVQFDEAICRYPGHAVKLGREARGARYRYVVCVGGDGTVNEVVNGIFSARESEPVPVLGVLPSGTGSDFSRTLGVPHHIEAACLRLLAGETTVCDLGVVSYEGEDGTTRRYFVNAAGVGYDAEVVRRRNGFSRYVRGTVPYVASVVSTFLSYENRAVTVVADGETRTHRILALVLGIGKYFGGGMRVAPEASIDDGLFDLVTIGDVGRLELLWNLPRVYRGTHLGHPKVTCCKASDVQVEADQPLLIQADGELLGRAPARFRVLPRALTVIC